MEAEKWRYLDVRPEDGSATNGLLWREKAVDVLTAPYLVVPNCV